MISALRGIVAEIDGSSVTLDVHGVGYELRCSRNCLQELVPGKEASIVVFTDVREDSINLFGFEDRMEKKVFLLLTKVKGVGAKSASDILSKIDKLELLRIIGSGDLGRLQNVKGIGKKTSERIIVELRDRVSSFAQEMNGGGTFTIEREQVPPVDEAIEVLVALGFTRREAEQAVQRAGSNAALPAQSGEIVREALRYV